jgi:hypothetical protein
MIRKGIQLKRTNVCFKSPKEGDKYVDGSPIEGPYCNFFFCKGYASWEVDGGYTKLPKGYERDEELTARETRDIVWFTKPVPLTGHSRTNMAYGKTFKKDGHIFVKVYWAEDGRVYAGSFHSGHCSCQEQSQ